MSKLWKKLTTGSAENLITKKPQQFKLLIAPKY